MATFDEQLRENKNAILGLSAGMNQLAEEMQRLNNHLITKEVPEPAQESETTIKAVDDEEQTYLGFKRRRVIVMFLAMIVFGFASLVSFKYGQWAFPISMGLFISTIGILFWIFVDHYALFGHSIKKLSANPIGVGLFVIALAILFWCGCEFGSSYVTNKYGHEEPAPRSAIEQPKQPATGQSATDTTTRGVGVVFPERTGKSAREQ